MINDKEIIDGCKAGKPKYQKILYERFAGQMMGLCKRYTSNTAEAEDMLQDAFIKVFLNIQNFRNECSLANWIKKLTINTLITHFRKSTSYGKSFYTEEMPDEFPDTKTPADISIPMDVLLSMVNQLPEGYRTVFNLREIEGFEYEQIAEMLNCSNATVRSQLFKAKLSLKSKIQNWKKNELF